MNCNRFRRNLPDWLRGGLTNTEIADLRAHASACRACAREEALERHLRSAWSSLSEAPAAPEMWPRIAAAIDTASTAPRFSWRSPKWAAASVFAAGALVAVLFVNRPAGEIGSTPRPVTVTEEQRVIQMVSELRQLPDLEAERMAMDPPHLRNSAILLGAIEER